ncbi:MAG TPA: hypothetical protein VGQ42_16595 [Candidatus Dormibacteraeota bacterium]|nr:hypothetical protein [Candidatus Dormibacteraeota bacterium]
MGAAIAIASALLPLRVFADQAAGSTANASTAALTLSINPTALLSIPQSAVPPQLQTLLAPVTVQIDSAHATASRLTAVADLVAGHGDATPIKLDVSSLNGLFTELHDALINAGSAVSIPSLQSALSDVATVTGNSTVMGLLPSTLRTQLLALNQQLASLNTTLAALPVDLVAAVNALQATLAQQLGAVLSYTTGVQADINATHPQGISLTQSALTVPPPVSLPPLVPSLPVIAQLAPFSAAAATAAGAQQMSLSGPQASSSESTSKIDIAPAMDLTKPKSDIAAVQGLLQQVIGSVTTIQPQLAGVAAIIDQALAGGLNLSTLGSQVSGAVAPAGVLASLVNGLGLNKLLSCDTLGTSSCAIAATSVTPQGTGLHALATSKLVDVQAVPMDATLASALSSLGAVAGTPLLDVQGVQASTDTFIDGSAGTQVATGSVTRIAVAGLAVIDNGQFNKPALHGHIPDAVWNVLPDKLPVGEPMPPLEIATGAGTLTLEITLGQPQTTYTGVQHRSASLGQMAVHLLNGSATGANPVTRLGASQAGPLVTMDTASVSSEVLGTAVDGSGLLVPTADNGSNVTMGKTGLFGPAAFLLGLGLLGAGGVLRRVSRGRRAA